MTDVWRGGFDLRGEQGDETRLLVNEARGFEMAIPGRPYFHEGHKDGIDIGCWDVDAVIEFRLDRDIVIRDEKLTPLERAHFRAALLGGANWPPTPKFAHRSTRLRLTLEAVRGADQKRRWLQPAPAFESFALRDAARSASPGTRFDEHVRVMEEVRACAGPSAEVLLRNLVEVESWHDYRGWLLQCTTAFSPTPILDEQAVVANPEPDEPRLAYANAIQLSDPARAELIELQVNDARAGRARKTWASSWREDQRIRDLRHAHEARWSEPVVELGWVKRVALMRGFVEWVVVSARDFIDRAEELYGRAPVLHVDFEDAKPHMKELAQSRHLERLHSLSFFKNGLEDSELIALAESPYLAKLRWLDIGRNQIREAGITALAASARLPSLRYVRFEGNACTDPTPQIGETDINSSAVLWMFTPPKGQELVRKYGAREWLSAEAVFAMDSASRADF